MKWAITALVAVLAVVTAARAAEEKVLICTDAEATGFTWENGEARTAKFEPVRFTVTVHPTGNRTIVSETFGKSIFLCMRSQAATTCIDIDDPDVSWEFRGSGFARASLYADQRDSDPNLIVSYGTCADPS